MIQSSVVNPPRALAIFGPRAAAQDLAPFSSAGAEITRVENLTGSEEADAALVFGGDGTIHRHLDALVQSQIPLLPVPTGSGNDFSNALGLGTVERALEVWLRFCRDRDNVHRIDLGLITAAGAAPEHFCCVAGAGLDSDANRRANAMPAFLRARGGYVLAALGAIAGFRPQIMTVSLADGRRISQPAMFVAFANAPSYGHGMRIAPRAEMEDGKLDVCFVRKLGRLRLLRFFPTVFSGRHLALPEVEYVQAESFRFETETPLDLYADGEFICRTPVDISIKPKALRVIC